AHARLERLPPAGGARGRAAQSRALGRHDVLPLSLRTAVRLRSVPADGEALHGAPRRARHHGIAAHPAGALRYEARLDPGARLVRRRAHRVSDPVSWLVIERGWKVLARDEAELGTVDEIVGDSREDIFDGLSVSSGHFATPRYLPSERVTQIEEGVVHTDVDALGSLSEYREPPPSEQILPTKASWWDRFRARF